MRPLSAFPVLLSVGLALAGCDSVIRLGPYDEAGSVADSTSGRGLMVDVVVDVTQAGKAVARPAPDQPAYYFPVTPGYSEGGDVLGGEKPPPPTAEVQHLIAKALYDQGYRVMNKAHQPSLLLIFWWGYKAPIILGERSTDQSSFNTGAPSPSGGGGGTFTSNQQGATAVFQLALLGKLPANLLLNHTEMEELVLGSKFEPQSLQNHPGPRLETAISMSRYPRYFLMVSALDFKAALRKEYVVLWTARVSTDLTGHTLDEVLPSLIAAGAPMFGRDTNGPDFSDRPVVPMGHVEVGTAVPKK